MGTWAEGNFDNDAALDYVGDLIDELVARIEEVFADEDRLSLDEDGEGVLVPSVAILSLLHKHCKAAPPKANIVKKWSKKYLRVFDEQIDGLLTDPKSSYKRKRRAVIERTFDRLEEQAREFWKK